MGTVTAARNRFKWREVNRSLDEISNLKLTIFSVVRRQLWLQHNEPTLSKAEAYDKARKEFYKFRLLEDTERRVAREEALYTGAQFGPSAMEIGMKLEDAEYERWKVWAGKQVEIAKQKQAAMYTGTDTGDLSKADDADIEGAMEEVSSSIPAQGQSAAGGAIARP